jgi:hypothetical protein
VAPAKGLAGEAHLILKLHLIKVRKSIFFNFACLKSGSSSVVEHQLPKLRVAGSTPVSRSQRMRELDENLAPFAFLGATGVQQNFQVQHHPSIQIP